VLAWLVLTSVTVDAQTSPAGQTAVALRVYLDCPSANCFEEYLRDEIEFVNFVRLPEDADIHLLVSYTVDTGGGGTQIVLRFIGVGRFDGVNRELKAISLAGDTESTRRDIMLRTAVVGLLGYLARDGLPPDVEVEVRAQRPEDQTATGAQDDPWHAWVFSIRGSAEIDAEESSRDRTWALNATADRTTEAWKISFGASWEQQTESFDLDEDEVFNATRRERQGEWFVARSAGPHWSFGFEGKAESSTFGNTSFSTSAMPAVEYSVFPYEEYATRAFRLVYSVGIVHATYNEITLFGKLEETHPQHKVGIAFLEIEPWGALWSGFEWSQYLHDASNYRLEVGVDLSLRITRGLSVDINASASRIRDQLSLPLRDATPEEVLLRLRQLESGFEVGLAFSLTYRFGSLFNNVVNPRFLR